MSISKHPKLPVSQITQTTDLIIKRYEPIIYDYVVRPEYKSITLDSCTIKIKTQNPMFNHYNYTWKFRSDGCGYKYVSPISGYYCATELLFTIQNDHKNKISTKVFSNGLYCDCETYDDVYTYLYSSKNPKHLRFVIVPKCVTDMKNKKVFGKLDCVQIDSYDNPVTNFSDKLSCDNIIFD